ncbi:hypothetical protein ACROYT_G025410 [Oculina patagonica]
MINQRRWQARMIAGAYNLEPSLPLTSGANFKGRRVVQQNLVKMQKQDDSKGNGREEELLPIDIYYNKLLDWLLDRRHCDVKWQTAVLEIREKINGAIQDMPPVDEISQLLSGTYINYFHCIRIVELLKVSESATKNIFGGYSSKRMKDWQEIVKLYEKNNVNLAEAAHLLIRNVNYEIPALKRQIGKCQQTQRECTRKESEFASNAALFKEKYQSVCKQMSIKGDNVKSELLSLLDELPEIYRGIAVAISGLKNATHYYETFVNFLVPRPVEAVPDIPATAATGTPITIPTPVSEVATAPEDRAAVTAPRQTTE